MDLGTLSVLAVIEAIEGPTDSGRCVLVDRPCNQTGTCALHVPWLRARANLLRVPALHADGERRSIAFTVTLLSDPDTGITTGTAAVIRDETQRWADERSLRAELAQLRSKG